MEDPKKQYIEYRSVILVGILGSLLSIPAYLIPEFGLLNLFLPLPYILLFNKHGHQKGTIAILITSMINWMVLGLMGLIWSLIGFGLIAVFMGGAFREKLSPVRTVVLTVVAVVASQLLQYYVQLIVFPELLHKVAEMFMPAWEKLFIRDIVPSEEQLIKEISLLLPGVKVVTSMVLGLVYYYFSVYCLRLMGVEVERLKPLKDWRLPPAIGLFWMLIVGSLGFDIIPINVITIAILLGLTALLAIQGSAVVAYLATRIGLYSWIRYVLLGLIVLFFWLILVLIGLAHNLLGVRKMFRSKKA